MKLTVNEIFKSFGDKLVLNGVSFSAVGGKALGLLGRNGAGKTTSIRIIMRVFSPDSGSVLLDGAPFNTDRVKIGYLPEERGLYPKKEILSQLVYFGKLAGLSSKTAKENALKLLDELQMGEYKNKRLDTLSKGNQQKIQLVATLIADPDIVILDEPFSGLDPVNAMMLKNLIKRLISNGKIVLFSSHQMNYIEEFCDDIAILNGGKIVLNGNIKEIKRSFERTNIEINSDRASEICSYIINKNLDYVLSCNCEDDTVNTKLKSEADKTYLYKELESFSDSIDSFKVKEPTLNEIFVKYTEEMI